MGEIKTESYNLVHALLKFFPNSLLFIFTSLPFMLLRELVRIMIRCLKLRHELFYLKNFPQWIKLPFFLPDGKLMIWEMRDFRYLFTVREIYIDDFYSLRNSRRKLNVIIDAGAHVGFFTMYGLNFIDVEGKIIALEPLPGNFSRLIRHLNLNSTKIKGSVLPLSYALSDKDGSFLGDN